MGPRTSPSHVDLKVFQKLENAEDPKVLNDLVLSVIPKQSDSAIFYSHSVTAYSRFLSSSFLLYNYMTDAAI